MNCKRHESFDTDSDGTNDCVLKSDSEIARSWGCARFEQVPSFGAPPSAVKAYPFGCSTNVKDMLFFFGGGDASSNTLYAFNLVSRTYMIHNHGRGECPLTSTDHILDMPAARTECSMTNDGENIVLFGGRTAAGFYMSDIWIYYVG